MTLGETIEQCRKKKGMKLATLAAAVGKSEAAMSGYENDNRVPDPGTVEEIANALESDAVRLAYLENNPVYRSIIPKVFQDLNNIRREPVVIFNRMAKEADEARAAALDLVDLFSNADPASMPEYESIFRSRMEQLVDMKRCVEISEFQLIALEIMSKQLLHEIYRDQQKKCEAKGYHIPRSGEDRRDSDSPLGCPARCDQRSGQERRTGTEG